MKMDLRMKATMLVAIISYLQNDHSCCSFLEHLGLSMRDEKGDLTSQGKVTMSLFFALLTYMVMSMRK